MANQNNKNLDLDDVTAAPSSSASYAQPNGQFASSANGPAQPGQTTTSAQSFSSFLSGTLSPTVMSEEGEKHRRALIEGIASTQNAIANYPLVPPYSGNLFVKNGLGYLVLYAAGSPKPRDEDNVPMSSILRDAAAAVTNYLLQNSAVRVDIIAKFLVFEEDYPKASALVNKIVQSLQFNATETDARGIYNAILQSKFHITYNQNAIAQFEAEYNPNGVPSYATSKFGLEVQDDTGNMCMIAAFGIYTEVRQVPQLGFKNGTYGSTQPMFSPIIHLPLDFTNIAPFPSFLALAIPFVVSEIIDKQLWLKPFMAFGDRNGLNLGAIFAPDPETGNTIEIADTPQLYEVLNRYFTRPIIVFDYTEGRANIPYIEALASGASAGNRVIGDVFAAFFRDPGLAGIQYVDRAFSEVIGTIKIDGVTMDTRAIDLFYMSKFLKGGDLDKFRVRGMNPADRIRDIRDQYRNLMAGGIAIPARYQNTVITLMGSGISKLSECFSQRVTVVADATQAQFNNFDYTAVINSYNNMMTPTFNYVAMQQPNSGYGYYRN